MRIVAGKHKGLVLSTFNAENIRPTIDRVREAIFSKIQFDIKDSVVLDLFGGTGAISLEFLSRGAKRVVTVDNSKTSIKLITENFKKAGEKPDLYECDYLVALGKFISMEFDFIFLDPPFDTDYAPIAMHAIASNKLLKPTGMIIYEHALNKEFGIPQEYVLLDEKKYGSVGVSFIGVKND